MIVAMILRALCTGQPCRRGRRKWSKMDALDNWTALRCTADGQSHHGHGGGVVTGKEERAASLLEALSALWTLAGSPSDRDLEARAALTGRKLARSTANNIRNGKVNPSWDKVEAFVAACLNYAQARHPRIVLPDEYAAMSQWRARYEFSADGARKEPSGKTAAGAGRSLQLPRSLESRAKLLDPHRGVAKFVGRSIQLEKLIGWCRNDAPKSLRLLTGPGGIGKTRLALELVRQLEEERWQCGWAGDRLESRALAELRADTSGPILLVVDYAETRVGLDQLLREAVADKGKVRVLLLARSAGQWWELLGAGEGAIRDLLADARMPLPEVVSESVSDEEHVRRAVPVFAGALGLEAPEPGSVTVLSHGRRTRILELHAAALVSVLEWNAHPGIGPTIDLAGVLGELLKHEERFWVGTALAQELMSGVGGLTPALLQQIVAAGCLLGAADEAEAVELLGRVPGAPQTAKVAAWLRELYPSAGHSREWLGTIEPDRLAERLVVSQLATSAGLAKSCLSDLSERQARRALLLLARAATEDDIAERLLRRLLPLAAQVVEDIDAPLPVLVSIANAIPYPSMVLATAHAAITRKILESSAAENHPAEHARWLTVRGLTLAQLGRPEEALPVTQQAVAAYRALAQANPDRYRADLAASLTGLGLGLYEIGHAAEALAATQEAADLYRVLAAASPGKFELDLAATLANLGARLSEVGRSADALAVTQEAVGLLREPPATATGRYWPDLAATLTNLGARLSEARRFAEAAAVTRESVALYRELASASPDQHRPDLAAALGNLGDRTADQGLPAEALRYTQEAATLLQELVADSPDRYLPNVAGTLASIGAQLLDMGRSDEALYAAQEALRLYRELAVSNPEWYRPSLASTLSTMARVLSILQCAGKAVGACQEAVGLYRQLCSSNPGRYNNDLARRLVDLGAYNAELGRPVDALAAEQAAAGLFREMAAADPDRYQPDYTLILMILGARLSELGRHRDALAVVREAVSNYRTLSAENPDYRPNLALALTIVGTMLALSDRPVDALRREAEAIGIYRELVAGSPGRYRPHLAASLTSVALQLSVLGRPAEALAATREALSLYKEDAVGTGQDVSISGMATGALQDREGVLGGVPGFRSDPEVFGTLSEATNRYRQLSACNPGYRPDLALALIGLGSEFSAADMSAEAVSAVREAVGIYRELAQADAYWYMPNLALALLILDTHLSATGRLEEALPAIQEAVELYRALAEYNPPHYRPVLAVCLDILGSRLADLGRPDVALASTREALLIYRDQVAGNRSKSSRGSVAGTDSRKDGAAGSTVSHESLQAAREAVQLQQTLTVVNPRRFRPSLASSLTRLAAAMSEAGNFNTALSSQQKAVREYRKLCTADPIRYREDLARAISEEASILRRLGRDDEADALLEEARRPELL